ncbi:MAG: short-chain dehydrogenase/reductase [Gemmatimonadaceae bacterium]|nr:short-chain dehydrogenase/reductase [Gemmatimonadaceae bacterium]
MQGFAAIVDVRCGGVQMRDQVVLITGPARGIGAAVARRLVAAGARVALVGLEPEKLRALAGELGAAAAVYDADVTDQGAIDAAVSAAVRHFGRLDVVITNAGIANMGTVAMVDVEAMARVIDVNVIGTMRTIKAALPHIIASRGYVLIVSSAAAFSPLPGMSAYAASKAAVEQLANVLRLEMLPHGVAVGSAHMTWVDTDMVRDVQRDLSSFRRTLARLPGPFGVVTPLETCTRAFVRACETRARTVFVPGTLGAASTLRMLLNGALLQRLLTPTMRPMLEEAEGEMRALGRAFGENSVGMGEGGADSDALTRRTSARQKST